MRWLLSGLLSAVLFLGLPGGPKGWAAEGLAKVGVFDLEKVVSAIDPGATVAKKPAKRYKGAGWTQTGGMPASTMSKEAQEVLNEIRRLSEQLDKAKGLSQQERDKRQKEIIGLRKKLTNLRQAARIEAQQKTPGPELRIRAGIARYAEENGFALLFEKGYWSEEDQYDAIIFNAKVPDVTAEIIQHLKSKGLPAIESIQDPVKRKKKDDD